jgi:hypothetical protein
MSELAVFMDTNVFLSFFHFANDDLQELRKLTVLAQQGTVILLLPDQVTDEFYRNRDGKVLDALKQLDEARLPSQFPRFCQDLPEYAAMRQGLDSYEKSRKALLEKVRAAAIAHELEADAITRELFGAGRVLEIGDEILFYADRRYRRGSPPGKQDKRESIGDAINWEALMSGGPDGDLYLIAEDTDWASPLEPAAFNSYLQDEWGRRKKGAVRFYRRLSAFVGEHFPGIKLEAETEKDKVIDELAGTRSYAQTHQTIAELRAAGDFTGPQLNAILSAMATNDQVYRILDDPDVKDFLMRIVAPRERELDPGLIDRLAQVADDYVQDKDLIGWLYEVVTAPERRA